jgi:hypothetical protein
VFKGAIGRVFAVNRELWYISTYVYGGDRRLLQFVYMPPFGFAPWVVICIRGRSLLKNTQPSGSLRYVYLPLLSPTVYFVCLIRLFVTYKFVSQLNRFNFEAY